jgi:hypothetical protein
MTDNANRIELVANVASPASDTGVEAIRITRHGVAKCLLTSKPDYRTDRRRECLSTCVFMKSSAGVASTRRGIDPEEPPSMRRSDVLVVDQSSKFASARTHALDGVSSKEYPDVICATRRWGSIDRDGGWITRHHYSPK